MTDPGRRMRKTRESDATKRVIRFQYWGTGGREERESQGQDGDCDCDCDWAWFGSGWVIFPRGRA